MKWNKKRLITVKFYWLISYLSNRKGLLVVNVSFNLICMCQETVPRAVGKRTPRIPISYTLDKDTRERYLSPVKRCLNQKGDDTDDDMEHEIALALAEASQRGGSTKNSHTSNRKAKMYSPDKKGERMVISFTVALYNSCRFFMKLVILKIFTACIHYRKKF